MNDRIKKIPFYQTDFLHFITHVTTQPMPILTSSSPMFSNLTYTSSQ